MMSAGNPKMIHHIPWENRSTSMPRTVCHSNPHSSWTKSRSRFPSPNPDTPPVNEQAEIGRAVLEQLEDLDLSKKSVRKEILTRPRPDQPHPSSVSISSTGVDATLGKPRV